MKTLIATATAACAIALALPAAAQDYSDEAEEAFAELVEGRTAGEPQSCISTFNSNRLNVVENVGITYRRGNTLWVARARDPERLDVWDIPVIERYGSRLCRHDVRTTIDRSSGFFSGVLFLEDFVPWTETEEG
ncbi:hypothetical protein [Aurantiacibacter aquimixticola]|uniref:Uncharacterized protein n=1 Tax=Aurantiacibacter aquimixticola TaxID=1958945 RepID=A0A419RUC0_9SPHN|nr:hypothetical protein [Aurantiacibacter aquimixticola]RJY09370.1 hypothetical protein D6201_08380 [Aurantiacibacter aquimixticola]